MARVVWTTFAVTLLVRKANALAISVWCTYAQAFLIRSGMYSDIRRPGGEYLASLRSECLDVSVVYLASGRSPCIWPQNFFRDAVAEASNDLPNRTEVIYTSHRAAAGYALNDLPKCRYA